MAIALDNPDLHEGREVVLWQVVPPRTQPTPPGQKRITSPVRAKGIVVPGGIDYNNGTVTVRTAEGEVVTGSLSDADFSD